MQTALYDPQFTARERLVGACIAALLWMMSAVGLAALLLWPASPPLRL
jgi:hypothetical protein